MSEAATRAVLAALVEHANTVEELRGCLTVRCVWQSGNFLSRQQLDRLGLRLTADSFTFVRPSLVVGASCCMLVALLG